MMTNDLPEPLSDFTYLSIILPGLNDLRKREIVFFDARVSM
jgi:hypothetical protein